MVAFLIAALLLFLPTEVASLLCRSTSATSSQCFTFRFCVGWIAEANTEELVLGCPSDKIHQLPITPPDTPLSAQTSLCKRLRKHVQSDMESPACVYIEHQGYFCCCTTEFCNEPVKVSDAIWAAPGIDSLPTEEPTTVSEAISSTTSELSTTTEPSTTTASLTTTTERTSSSTMSSSQRWTGAPTRTPQSSTTTREDDLSTTSTSNSSMALAAKSNHADNEDLLIALIATVLVAALLLATVIVVVVYFMRKGKTKKPKKPARTQRSPTPAKSPASQPKSPSSKATASSPTLKFSVEQGKSDGKAQPSNYSSEHTTAHQTYGGNTTIHG